jgi:ribonuclease HI
VSGPAVLPEVTIYTDGACTGNPGAGGYAAVLLSEGKRREISGGFARTTNNRMELTAAIEALKLLPQASRVKLYSDSKYLVDAVNLGWARRWKANRWRRSSKEPALNPDLWAELLRLLDRHQVQLIWVRGHAGNRENERCDRLSVAAAARPGLPPDPGYQPEDTSAPTLF